VVRRRTGVPSSLNSEICSVPSPLVTATNPTGSAASAPATPAGSSRTASAASPPSRTSVSFAVILAIPFMIAQRVADVVTVEVVRNALNAAADEMGTNLARSAYTPIIYEMKDYSVAIFNARFELLGQAPGLPIFLGALEDAVRLTVEHYGEDSV